MVRSAAAERRLARSLRSDAMAATTFDALLDALSERHERITIETTAGTVATVTLIEATSAGLVGRRDDNSLWLAAASGIAAITIDDGLVAASPRHAARREESWGALIRRHVADQSTVRCRGVASSWHGVVDAIGDDVVVLRTPERRSRTYLSVDSVVELASADSSS